MIKFSKSNVISLQQFLIKKFGGVQGVKDFNLLDSALESLFQTFDGMDLYPTLQEKGARLGYNLISSHCFIDGNKRIGMLVMLSFFKANGVKLTYTNDDVIKIGLGIASGEINYKQLIIWVKSHQKEVELNSVL